MVRPGKHAGEPTDAALPAALIVTCTLVKTNARPAIICGAGIERAPCDTCGRPSGYLCDWKTSTNQTCDKPMCSACAYLVATNKHLCPRHRDLWNQHPANQQPLPFP